MIDRTVLLVKFNNELDKFNKSISHFLERSKPLEQIKSPPPTTVPPPGPIEPSDQAVPTPGSSWGRIKQTYRRLVDRFAGFLKS